MEFKEEHNHLSSIDQFLILRYVQYYKGSSVRGAFFNSSEHGRLGEIRFKKLSQRYKAKWASGRPGVSKP